MPTQTITLKSQHGAVALLDVELETPQSGRAVELRVENNSKRPAVVRLARADGKGHVTERRVEPTGVVRITPGSGLDPAIAVTIDRDGRPKGIDFSFELLPLDVPDWQRS